MLYPEAAVERAMKRQEVICRALAGTLTWLQAADILGIDPRSLRRWRARYQADGVLGLYDRRQLPSPRKAPIVEVQHALRLYRERYRGWNVRHFYRFARRDHALRLSYSFVKLALQEAGLVRKGRARGCHRRRREPRACFGELLHLDGSPHAWLALCPTERQNMITIIDDATKRLLYAQLWPTETAEAVMTALRTVIQTHGLPMALYTDRAGWAFHTPTAGGRVDLQHLTQVGRALAQLGIEHIPAYSPQARGRGQHTLWHGTRCFGQYDAQGRPLPALQREPPPRAASQRPYNRRSRSRPYRGIPRNRPQPRRRRGPRLPVYTPA